MGDSYDQYLKIKKMVPVKKIFFFFSVYYKPVLSQLIPIKKFKLP